MRLIQHYFVLYLHSEDLVLDFNQQIYALPVQNALTHNYFTLSIVIM